MRTAQCRELGVPLQHLRIAHLQRCAVEGVAQTLHPRLVTVVDRRDARQPELHGRREQLQLRTARCHGICNVERCQLCACAAAGVKVQRQRRARARHVVACRQVHERVVQRLRIVQPLTQQQVCERARRAAPGQKCDQRVAQGIVHDAVERIAERVLPPCAVADLRHGILPHLAEEHAVGIGLLGGGAQVAQHIVRQLVGHVQPPAGRAVAQPCFDHAVFARDHVFAPVGVCGVDGGQVAEIPPALVVVGIVGKIVPARIDGIAAVIRAAAGIVLEAVEVAAVRARVGKHAVEHDADAARSGGSTQLLEVRVRAEDRIDLPVISGVIAVVGGALEDGVEIQHRHAELLQIGQPVRDAAQRAAVEVDGRIFALGGVGLPLDRLLPIGVRMHGLLHAAVVLHAALRGGGAVARKAVGEDLIHHAGAKPFRRRKAGAIDRQPPAVLRLVTKAGMPPVRRSAEVADAAVVARDAEAVAQRLRCSGHGHGRGKARSRLRHGDGVAVRIAVELHGGVEHERLRVREGEAHGRTGLQRAEWTAERLITRVVLRRGVLRQQEQIQVRIILRRAREAEVLRHGLPLHAEVGIVLVVIERERAANGVGELIGVEVCK